MGRLVRTNVVTSQGASGPLDTNADVIWLLGTSVLAMTLGDPDLGDNGKVVTIMATGAAAHTVDYTGGFSGKGTSFDKATFSAARGNNFTIMAENGKWAVLNLTGVTLG